MPEYELVGDFGFNISDNDFGNYSVVHKFGANLAVSTSYVPVTIGGVYQTPQPASATQLRVKAGGNAADTAGGNGAREITLQGLNASGELIEEAIATAGASASGNTTNSFMRLFRAYVSASGTYATQSAGSHSDAITIENSGGGTDWLTIDATGFPKGQSEVGAYSVPLGKRAFVPSIIISVDSTKTADVLFFQRQNILEAAAPYSAMRVVLQLGGVSGEETFYPKSPLGPFPPLTDIGFLAKVASTTAEVDVDFEIILVDD